jgi:hypothetical protein
MAKDIDGNLYRGPDRIHQDLYSSAIKRAEKRDRSLTQEIREFISVANRNFTVTGASHTVTNRNTKTRATIRVILARLVNEGLIERVPPHDNSRQHLTTRDEEQVMGPFQATSLRLPTAPVARTFERNSGME